MQSEKCKSCFECSETIVVMVRDERGGEWRESSVRRCANDQCWHIVDGTREDRLLWIDNVYGYKYFGDYELSPEQLSAVYEAKALAALSDKQAGEVKAVPLKWSTEKRSGFTIHIGRGLGLKYEAAIKAYSPGWIVTIGQSEVVYDSADADEDAAKAAAQADYEQRIRSALVDVPAVEPRKFKLGDHVCKTKGSSWIGHVVGFYSTELTPVGYAVESSRERGSVQIYPEAALKLIGPAPHREGEDSAEVERRFHVEWLAGARPPVHPEPMVGRTTFRTFDEAISHMGNQAEDEAFISLEERITTTVDRSSDARAALAATRSGSATTAKGGRDDG
ncbi:hypothetical protein [Shinella sp.]|uniref:hypothetical protein n=1 Tax=Shinella sp. TaxID=1870904 RepID=UPI0028AF18A9|nr:hypothetical protein [Shinella sp.]